MTVWQMLWAEIRFRKLNFVLGVLAIAVAVALFVAGPVVVDAYSRQTQVELQALESRVTEAAGQVAAAEKNAAAELDALQDDTRKAMKGLGFNLLLVQRDTDIVQFLANRLPTIDMPQEYVDRLAADRRLTLITHLVATLRTKIAWEGRDVLLTGYLPETPQSHMKHDAPMGYVVEPGTVLLGHHLAKERQPGQTVSIRGREFRIAEILPEQGSEDDVQITLNLRDAQTLLEKPGQINMILALECRCGENALPEIRKQIQRTLPETQVVRDVSKAVARAKQREMVAQRNKQIIATQQATLAQQQQAVEVTAARRRNVQHLLTTLWGVITPLVVVVAAIWVGLLALLNVRERRAEIGLLRAIGKGSGMIATLLLGKAALSGLLGAVLGVAAGGGLALFLAQRSLEISSVGLLLPPKLFAAALGGAPLVAALASYLPTLVAVSQDPAIVLRET